MARRLERLLADGKASRMTSICELLRWVKAQGSAKCTHLRARTAAYESTEKAANTVFAWQCVCSRPTSQDGGREEIERLQAAPSPVYCWAESSSCVQCLLVAS